MARVVSPEPVRVVRQVGLEMECEVEKKLAPKAELCSLANTRTHRRLAEFNEAKLLPPPRLSLILVNVSSLSLSLFAFCFRLLECVLIVNAAKHETAKANKSQPKVVILAEVCRLAGCLIIYTRYKRADTSTGS